MLIANNYVADCFTNCCCNFLIEILRGDETGLGYMRCVQGIHPNIPAHSGMVHITLWYVHIPVRAHTSIAIAMSSGTCTYLGIF